MKKTEKKSNDTRLRTMLYSAQRKSLQLLASGLFILALDAASGRCWWQSYEPEIPDSLKAMDK